MVLVVYWNVSCNSTVVVKLFATSLHLELEPELTKKVLVNTNITFIPDVSLKHLHQCRKIPCLSPTSQLYGTMTHSPAPGARNFTRIIEKLPKPFEYHYPKSWHKWNRNRKYSCLPVVCLGCQLIVSQDIIDVDVWSETTVVKHVK